MKITIIGAGSVRFSLQLIGDIARLKSCWFSGFLDGY